MGSRPPESLPRAFFDRPVLDVARDLLGRVVVHTSDDGVDGVGGGTVAVRLTEVEAYAGPGDPGSHAARGRTPRTAVMFGPPGHAYVYFSYGMHWCANLVCGPEGTASAVLLRAGEVVSGLELARHRRPTARKDVDLARGPARLAAALGLGQVQDGADLCAPSSALRVLDGRSPSSSSEILTGPRVGVSGEGGDGARYPWRLWLTGEPTVSAYRVAAPRRRRAGSAPTTSTTTTTRPTDEESTQ
ncbi:DNA-3-methyladenine glycosylase [Quadrisphaera granulorum]|uniref:Putative 3-methyladenine DNA glycosylase n=1 Tax=Quadrisphaera granulorum TaxID=317664 RepID=A0A316A0F6_9ACTN|nr:DNA-3-methyladenine glycosylase [Quadrisphaera granulorum]PWJ50194.1 DNA-3-methyladenine glycosylase [Quadrisphaera granulorum]SZE97960.1 DNA-3-methyladenine glycosylase [Quadrisphaera granulorum]